MRSRTGQFTAMGLAFLAGCSQPAQPSEPVGEALSLEASGHVHEAGAGSELSTRARAQLAEVKARYQAFRRFDFAVAKGWGTEITGCYADPTLGGMGFHYGNVELIDGTVDYRRPEVVLYRPTASGEKELVAVEYIVPFTAWNRDEPPSLFGQQFGRNLTFQVWALHVWLYRENPSGLFASWNPRVTCP